ncbi:MAG TPA: acyltransferase domain-containing protein, partial [Propionibacteriaceae bacterium]|nr:acyltransferase domain-containing protein [Propionibacteriaceae bacterium]
VVHQFREHMEQLPPWRLMDLPALFDPVVDPDAPAEVRWLYVVAFAQVLPETLEVHARREVPEETSRATFADVGRHVRIARRLYGVRACIEQNWLQAHLRGLLYDLGRLQFNLARLQLSQDELDAAGIDATPGTVVLETHIPECGPLDPAAADASFARAQEFFATHFPELGAIRFATCDSWLLDPQLAGIVPGSNIVRFGERYRLFRTARESDQSALDFVFRAPTTPRDQLPRDTRLQRGLLDHLAAGGHIEARYGWLELPVRSTV